MTIKFIYKPQNMSQRFKRMARQLPQSIDIGLRGLADETTHLFKVTTMTWDHQPAFTVAKEGKGYTVGTDDRIYAFVDQGTRRHVIRARNVPRLSFIWGGPGSYKAKTRVGVIGSQTGGPTGTRVWRKQVQHPGTKARGFSKKIYTIQQRRARVFIEHALKEAAAGSGFGL